MNQVMRASQRTYLASNLLDTSCIDSLEVKPPNNSTKLMQQRSKNQPQAQYWCLQTPDFRVYLYVQV